MLVMTRKEGSSIYGGIDLSADLKQTFDHVITVSRVVDQLSHRYVELDVAYSDGTEEGFVLDAKTPECKIDGVVRVVLMGVHCVANNGKRPIPTARLGFEAPRSYKLVRDDAIKKTR